MKKESHHKKAGMGGKRPAFRSQYVVGLLLAGIGLASAAEKEEDKSFEGGSETHNNWVELSAGAMLPSGNKSQAQQQRHFSEGAFGGIEDLHLQYDVAKKTMLSVDGRALFDQNDYRLSLGLAKEEMWFLRFNFEEFRTWYNGDGGFFPPGSVWYPLGGDALGVDRGEISFEAGWTPKNLPALTFKYARLYRNGEKSSTVWGQTHPLFTSLTRGLSPTIYDLDEKRDIFELNATHHIKATDFGLGLRYETGDLNNAKKISQWPGEPAIERKITDREGTKYDMFNVHAFSETWIKKNLFFSSGLLFANVSSDASGSRIYGSDFDVSYAPNALNGEGYYDLNGGAQKQEYVLNLNLMSLPTTHLTVVPSVRVQKEFWDADSSAISTLGTTSSGPLGSNAEGDSLDVRERLDVRYTGFTNLILFAQGEWTQGQGNLEENGSIGLGSPIQRETEDSRSFQKYSAGVKWYAARRVSVDMGGYYKLNAYDYDNVFDNTPNGGANRYPAYLVMQNFKTYDANTRLTLRPLQNLTLVTRYEYQLSTIHTQPDSVSGLSEVESSEMTSHIFSQNVSWSPLARLYLQVGFDYVVSETETPASQVTQAILDAQNNYWTLNFNAGLALDNKTDLNIGYTWYRADNYTDNSAAGLPYGVGAEEHGVSATIVRRINERLRLTLRYGYYTYNDETFGGNTDYDTHVVYAAVQYRF